MANPHPRDRALIALHTILDAKLASWKEFSTNLRLQIAMKKAGDPRAIYAYTCLFGIDILFRQQSTPAPLWKLNLAMDTHLKEQLINKSLSVATIESNPGLLQVWNTYASIDPQAYTLSAGPQLLDGDVNLINNYLAGLIDFWRSCLERLEEPGELEQHLAYLETVQGFLGQALVV